MTTERSYTTTDIAVTTDDLSVDAALHKAVQVGGTFATTNSNAVGVLKTKGKTGERVGLAWLGEMKVVAGAAITAGAKVSVTTSGFFITSPVSTAPVGKALETCASGDLVRVIANFANGLWT